jgi:hypothetical protein
MLLAWVRSEVGGGFAAASGCSVWSGSRLGFATTLAWCFRSVLNERGRLVFFQSIGWGGLGFRSVWGNRT